MKSIHIPIILCLCALGAGTVCMCGIFPAQMAMVGILCVAAAAGMADGIRNVA